MALGRSRHAVGWRRPPLTIARGLGRQQRPNARIRLKTGNDQLLQEIGLGREENAHQGCPDASRSPRSVRAALPSRRAAGNPRIAGGALLVRSAKTAGATSS